MAASARLLAALASGRFVSGESLARDIGVSRAAVWKQISTLRRRGIPIDAVRGRGYRLHGGTPLLDHDSIQGALHLPVRTKLETLAVLMEVDSTNSWLLDHSAVSGPAACIAEWQTAGRGRRGRNWHAPFGTALCLSLAYPFAQLPAGFGGIGLVAGVAVADALAALGYRDVRLKWPNDLVVDGAKLGGLLVESRGEAGGATRAVVGVGINWRLPAGELDGVVDGKWTDLAAQPVTLVSRDMLAAQVLNSLVGSLDAFAHNGFAGFRSRWAGLDSLYGKTVEVQLEKERVEGKAAGIDDDGALQVKVGGDLRRFTAGEVTVREEG